MASPSPFDDLLKEFDDDTLAPRRPPEDPLRGENLQKLLALSKKLEAIAKMLDPSDAKHPLNGQTVPEEARARLKSLVNQLMTIQDTLHEIEKALLEEQVAAEAAPPEHPPTRDRFDDLERPPFADREEQLPPRRRPPTDQPFLDEPDRFARPRPLREPPTETSSIQKTTDSPPSTGTQPPPLPHEDDPLDAPPIATVAAPPNAREPSKETEPLPEPNEIEHPSPTTTPPSPPPIPHDHLHLEKEKQEFAAYKTKWEDVFTADPSQRAAHPEVQQYYDQMEAYFHEKMAYINAKNPQP